MKRVMIIGNAGGGKSTLARKIANDTALPCHSLDTLMWNPGWTRIPDDTLLKAQTEILKTPAWIIDGTGPENSIAPRIKAADTIIHIDLPLHTHLALAMKRQLASLRGRDHDAPPGCPRWRVTGRLISMIFWIHRNLTPKIRHQTQNAHHARLIHITNLKTLKTFAPPFNVQKILRG